MKYLFPLFFLFLLGVSPVFAAVLYSQTDNATFAGCEVSDGCIQPLGNGLSGTVTSIAFSIYTNVDQNPVTAYLVQCSSLSCETVTGTLATSNDTFAPPNASQDGQIGTVDFTPYTLDPTKYYGIKLSGSSNRFDGSATVNYASSNLTDGAGGTDGRVESMYFVVNGTSGGGGGGSTTASTTLGSSTTTPLYTQDSGDLSFELAILIFFAAMQFMGMFFNLFFKKRLSRQNDV